MTSDTDPSDIVELEFQRFLIVCVRSCDQLQYLHTKTKERIFIKIDFDQFAKVYFTPPTWPLFLFFTPQYGRRDVM